MFLERFTSQTNRVRSKTQQRLEEYNKPSTGFFVFISLASALAVLGLALDSAAIVIGAMVVAPIITPIFGFALATILANGKRMFYSLVTITLGTILSISMAVVFSLLIMLIEEQGISVSNEILARTEPDLLYFLVALISGMIGAYAHAKNDIMERVSGIAISVAIIPPLSVVGIGIAMQAWELATQSFWLYIFNLIGICFGSVLMFIFVGFGKDISIAKK